MRRFGSTCTSRSTSVVLPVPDGADTMKSSPRRLLDILNLLPHALEFRLRLDDQLRDVQSVGLGPDRVDLAVHLLQQKIELAAARFRARGQRRPVREVAAKPRHFFSDVRPL